MGLEGYIVTFKKRMILAEREIGRSVVALNPSLNVHVKDKHPSLFYGIKDTNQIPKPVLARLTENSQMVFLTIDKAALLGRAIDPDLNNPITYRVMTGSTSGGPINILKGINDFAIGTDGGGSVLAPAMSCQLPSVIGAGLGLFTNNKSISTDGIEFNASVGVIAKNISMLNNIMGVITAKKLTGNVDEKLSIVIPKKGTVICPDQVDMNDKVMYYLSKIDQRLFDCREVDMTGIEDRRIGMKLIQGILEKNKQELIITCEGPIDVFGYGETIPRKFGKVGEEITENSGKYLVRSANICQTTAITVPTNNLATGLLIIAKKGFENANKALFFAKKLEEAISLPAVWKRYFFTSEKEVDRFTFTNQWF